MNYHNAWGRETRDYSAANLRLEKALADNPDITNQCIEFSEHKPDWMDARQYMQYRPMWFDPQKHKKEEEAARFRLEIALKYWAELNKDCLTVGELIAQLQTLDPSMKAFSSYEDDEFLEHHLIPIKGILPYVEHGQKIVVLNIDYKKED